MPQNPRFFKDRDEWRRWLQENHEKSPEIWIRTFKTHTGKPCLSYQEALEEALCFGWIDSRLRRIDDEQHMWRFAPRKMDSIWSLGNRRRAEKLMKEGRMEPSGLKKIEAAKRSGEWENAISPSTPPKMPKDLKSALMKNEAAWRNFQAFANSYRTTYIYWVSAAKREETRKKRIEQVVKFAKQNVKQPFPQVGNSA